METVKQPLVRWTIGPTNSTGLEILRESVSLFSYVYPEFKRVVCFNHIEKSQLVGVDADLLEQNSDMVPFELRRPDSNPEEASGCGWKLCPPRLNSEGYELWIDNDLVILKKVPSIDHWLSVGGGIISKGSGRRRMYGAYDGSVPAGLHVCAGLFGLPPSFDFQSAIESRLLRHIPLGGYDEQGLTASILTNMDMCHIVPSSEVCICEDYLEFPEVSCGIHFAAANRKPWHRGWKFYKSFKLL